MRTNKNDLIGLKEIFTTHLKTDESSIQMDWHKQYSCRKEGERPRPKLRPKHPTKVHVWAGISKKGATGICIFEGKMNAPLFWVNPATVPPREVFCPKYT